MSRPYRPPTSLRKKPKSYYGVTQSPRGFYPTQSIPQLATGCPIAASSSTSTPAFQDYPILSYMDLSVVLQHLFGKMALSQIANYWRHAQGLVDQLQTSNREAAMKEASVTGKSLPIPHNIFVRVMPMNGYQYQVSIFVDHLSVAIGQLNCISSEKSPYAKFGMK